MNVTRRNFITAGLAASAALTMAACDNGGDTTGGTGEAPVEGALNITFIGKIRQENFWNAVESGATKAAEDLGVNLTIQGDPSGSNTAARQATYIETATTKGENAICFAALDANTTDSALQEAMDAGIKVIGFDSDPGPEARNWFVNQADPNGIAVAGLDDIAAKMTEMGFTADKKAVVYLVSTNPTTPNQNTWIEYVKQNYFSDYEIPMNDDGSIDFDTAKANTKAGGYTVADAYAHLDVRVDPDTEIIYGADDYQTSKTLAGNTLAANPDTNALFVLTTNADAAVYEAIQEKGMTETCIFNGIGVPTDCAQYLEDGTMTTVVLWQAYDLGYLAVNAAVAACNDELAEGNWVSNLSGTDQVEGVSTYPSEGHVVKNGEIILGDPAVFTVDTVDKFKS